MVAYTKMVFILNRLHGQLLVFFYEEPIFFVTILSIQILGCVFFSISIISSADVLRNSDFIVQKFVIYHLKFP